MRQGGLRHGFVGEANLWPRLTLSPGIALALKLALLWQVWVMGFREELLTP